MKEKIKSLDEFYKVKWNMNIKGILEKRFYKGKEFKLDKDDEQLAKINWDLCLTELYNVLTERENLSDSHIASLAKYFFNKKEYEYSRILIGYLNFKRNSNDFDKIMNTFIENENFEVLSEMKNNGII